MHICIWSLFAQEELFFFIFLFFIVRIYTCMCVYVCISTVYCIYTHTHIFTLHLRGEVPGFCVCTCTCVCIHVYFYRHTFFCLYVYIFAVCKNICLYVYIFAVCKNMYVKIYTYRQFFLCKNIFFFLQKYTRIGKKMYVCKNCLYVYIFTYIAYTCIFLHTFFCLCIYTCIYVNIICKRDGSRSLPVYISVCMCICIRFYVYKDLHICIWTLLVKGEGRGV